MASLKQLKEKAEAEGLDVYAHAEGDPTKEDYESALADHEAAQAKAAPASEADHPDTPSGLALAAVGPAPEYVEGEPFDAEAANAHGEAYQEEKRKHRWG